MSIDLQSKEIQRYSPPTKAIKYKLLPNGCNIQTNGDPTSLLVTFESKTPVTLMVSGKDKDRMNTSFFTRKVLNFSDIKELEFPMPLTPKILSIKLWDEKTEGEKEGLRILNIEQAPIKTGVISVAKSTAQYDYMMDYIRFATEFAKQAGYVPLGHYESPSKKFKITYEELIHDHITGEVKRTPAVIYRKTGWIRIAAKRFRGMSIPMRLIILYHEFFHHFWDSSDETLMDISALNVYLAQGFSKSEALYAFTRVFSDYEPLKKRVKINDSYIRDFSYVNDYVEGFEYN